MALVSASWPLNWKREQFQCPGSNDIADKTSDDIADDNAGDTEETTGGNSGDDTGINSRGESGGDTDGDIGGDTCGDTCNVTSGSSGSGPGGGAGDDPGRDDFDDNSSSVIKEATVTRQSRTLERLMAPLLTTTLATAVAVSLVVKKGSRALQCYDATTKIITYYLECTVWRKDVKSEQADTKMLTQNG